MTENIFNDRPRKNEKQESIDYVKSLIEQARTDARDSDIPKLEKLVQLLNSKKYGLVWEEHAEKVEEEMKTKIPVFVEDEIKKINDNPDSEDFNFLLEGDNLHSLHLLEKTHFGKIDVIYIDPPYNTGNKDFKYNDSFVDTEDTFRHSKWISFMERRLKIAKTLLSEEGIIFISIDDNEQSQLKMLMDEIFGEEKFIANIAVETSNGLFGVKAKHINKTIVKSKDYVLVYSNSPEMLKLNPIYTKSKKAFDTHFTIYRDEQVEMPLSNFIKENSLFQKRSKQLNINNSIQNIGVLMDSFPDINSLVLSNASNIYRMRDYTLKIPDEYIEQYENGDKIKIDDFFIFKNKNGKPMYLYPFARLVKQTDDYISVKSSSVIVGDFWKGFNDDMGNVGKEGGVKLSNGKKPIRLIRNILKLANKKDALVLDFFAGSGTTAHAVMDLNKKDGGNRKFILATNDEVVETTYQRMENISSELSLNLKYFKTDFVIKEDFPNVSLEYELLKYITPLVELEFTIDISNPQVQIVLNEEQLESLINNKQLISNSTIFMHPDVFRDDKQNQVLQDLQIKVQEIPNYFFGTELWAK